MKPPRKKSPIAPKLVGCKNPAMMRPMVPASRPLPSASNRRGKHGAKLYWASNLPTAPKQLCYLSKVEDAMTPHPVHVLPASPEAFAQMVEVGAKALHKQMNNGTDIWFALPQTYRDLFVSRARAVLLALGLSADGKEGK